MKSLLVWCSVNIIDDQKRLQYVLTQQELNLMQGSWLELFKDVDMSINYHPTKANVVADASSRLSRGSNTHVEDEKRELSKNVHRFVRLGV